MRKECRFIKAYGKNEYGLADMPTKVSGVFISRIKIGEEMGCSICFPHGPDTNNRFYFKWQRSWKKHRKHQWKD